jgi:hypothetical protein
MEISGSRKVENFETKKRLLELEKSGNFVFHGTERGDVETFEPRQALNYKGNVGEPDGQPAVFASDKVDYAILMGMVNKNNCPYGYSSSSRWSNDELILSVDKKGYDQLTDSSVGYVYVFNKSDFSEREPGHTEYVSYSHVKPIQIFKISKHDLSRKLIIYEK